MKSKKELYDYKAIIQRNIDSCNALSITKEEKMVIKSHANVKRKP